VQRLQKRLSRTDEQKVAKNYTVNSEAYQLYLKGRFYRNKRTTKDNEKAIEYFQQAIALDSSYALAYAGLADAYTPPLNRALPGKVARAREAAIKAVSLDDKLAETHTALARVLTVEDFDFTSAERECRRAIELNPNYTDAHHRYADLLGFQGRWKESFAEYRRALEIEPLNLVVNSLYGYRMIFARQYDEAILQLKKTLELDSNFINTHSFLSLVFQLKGDYAKSIEEQAKFFELNNDKESAALARESFAKDGWNGYLQAMTRELKPGSLEFFLVASCYVALGERDKAFAALDQSYENREPAFAGLKVDPRLDPLRSDPRFQELVQRVGFK
jgi:tetratricopeptide (TPR) repeat protein